MLKVFCTQDNRVFLLEPISRASGPGSHIVTGQLEISQCAQYRMTTASLLSLKAPRSFFLPAYEHHPHQFQERGVRGLIKCSKQARVDTIERELHEMNS